MRPVSEARHALLCARLPLPDIAPSLFVPALAGATLLAGCASTHMAFQDDDQRAEAITQNVVLMAVTLKNHYHTTFQPRMNFFIVQRPDKTDYKGRINFPMDDKVRMETGSA